jgi:hypothetical protein
MVSPDSQAAQLSEATNYESLRPPNPSFWAAGRRWTYLHPPELEGVEAGPEERGHGAVDGADPDKRLQGEPKKFDGNPQDDALTIITLCNAAAANLVHFSRAG